MPVSQHTIAGTVLTMPVVIRKADQHSAMFSVKADAAQRLIDYSGLEVFQYLPGRAILVQLLVRYIDGDLGKYHEYGTAFLVNKPGTHATGIRAMADAATFIHQLPVDQEFTLEAGRTIWGYPKIMADFNVREGRKFAFDVSADGHLIAGIEFSPGLPHPAPKPQTLTTYSCLDGVTRETSSTMQTTGVRTRLGGAKIRLGDHPYAKELATLGLPKRALMTQSVTNVEMSFGDARAV
ncbi:acetoacetate decarboxylase [Mycobacterium gordonae]|uniref:Acetoacetate decarboxylase n=1 Tax=Mycobacterium gordonae TaxID=1778 RepID=A0A0Q2U2J4_MYCGO|nr:MULTISPECIES: acetoacetate decarboxylase family protein [Mycobacterium]KQH75032.1 acetoacetate decarboxylase [Mycobacterium gordonae]MDP7731878.1 acetoacetate decarboxylase family protein [Mycobacterium sp. TY813]